MTARERHPSPAARERQLAYNRAYWRALRALAQTRRAEFERIFAQFLDDELNAPGRRAALEQATTPRRKTA